MQPLMERVGSRREILGAKPASPRSDNVAASTFHIVSNTGLKPGDHGILDTGPLVTVSWDQVDSLHQVICASRLLSALPRVFRNVRGFA